MKHFSEEDLIAYQLHESADERAIAKHLENCSECADLSESIAETLRVFSADPVPLPNLEHNWHRLRGNLSVLTPEPRRSFELLRWKWAWPSVGLATAALVLLTVFGMRLHRGGRSETQRCRQWPWTPYDGANKPCYRQPS